MEIFLYEQQTTVYYLQSLVAFHLITMNKIVVLSFEHNLWSNWLSYTWLLAPGSCLSSDILRVCEEQLTIIHLLSSQVRLQTFSIMIVNLITDWMIKKANLAWISYNQTVLYIYRIDTSNLHIIHEIDGKRKRWRWIYSQFRFRFHLATMHESWQVPKVPSKNTKMIYDIRMYHMGAHFMITSTKQYCAVCICVSFKKLKKQLRCMSLLNWLLFFHA